MSRGFLAGLSKAERSHLRSHGIRTLQQCKDNKAHQDKFRQETGLIACHHCSRINAKLNQWLIDRSWKKADLLYSLENAAEFLEGEEWPEPSEKQAQEAANREAARRIRALAKRLV